MSLDFSQPFTEKTGRIVAASKLLKTSGRKKSAFFLVEGSNSVEAAVITGSASEVYITESAAKANEQIVLAAKNLSVPVEAITDKAALALSDTVTSPGIFALCKQNILWNIRDIIKGKPKLLVVCVEIRDPGNAGTMVRNADALGADAVIFLGDCVDVLSPKVVRASAGSVFNMPIVKFSNVSEFISRLRGANIQVLATSAQGSLALNKAGEILTRPTAWFFGNEAHGLDEEIIQQAEETISIPILGKAESLNIVTAASICLYQSASAMLGELEKDNELD